MIRLSAFLSLALPGGMSVIATLLIQYNDANAQCCERLYFLYIRSMSTSAEISKQLSSVSCRPPANFIDVNECGIAEMKLKYLAHRMGTQLRHFLERNRSIEAKCHVSLNLTIPMEPLQILPYISFPHNFIRYIYTRALRLARIKNNKKQMNIK